jgi:exopolysaccharide production protein ExoZ
MISNLQALRAFAAIAVVFYHTGYFFGTIHTEFSGVAIFFCLSGFMMTYVSRRNSDGFVVNRLIRIVPMYWFATSALAIWMFSGLSNPVVNWSPMLQRHSVGVSTALVCLILFGILFYRNARFRTIVTAPRPYLWAIFPILMLIAAFVVMRRVMATPEQVIDLVKSVLFIPYRNADGGMFPVLGVGWTLNIEMVLYLLFATMLMLSHRAAPLLVALAIPGVALVGRFFFLPEWMVLYTGSYPNSFASGIGIFYFWRYCLKRSSISPRAALAGFGVVAVFFLTWHLFPAIFATLAQAAPFVVRSLGSCIPEIVMITVLIAHEAGLQISAKFPMQLGAASYSIYLTHGIVLETIRPVGERWPLLLPSNSFAAACLAVGISVIVGVIAYWAIELPMLNALKGLVFRRRSRHFEIPATSSPRS